MTPHSIDRFEKFLTGLRNPRQRRGFVDSFHAGLVRGEIYSLDQATIEAAAVLEEKHGFMYHAKRLLTHPHYQGFAMPGAENFAEYLQSLVNGKLRTKGYKVLDRSYDMNYAKEWEVYVGDEMIGQFRTFGPHPKESGVELEYSGRIPRYTNEAILVGNQFRDDNRNPEEVSLIWSNQRCDLVDEAILRLLPRDEEVTPQLLAQLKKEHWYHTGEYFPVIVNTPWQRQDGHDSIPFP